MLPLEGYTVLDLTRAVAGPFCTMLLGDMGATVWKIEEPGTGDETRQWGPPFAGEDSTYFLGVNRNKKSVVLDLKTTAGREALLQLAAKADVVVENFRPGVAERLGAGYEQLKAVRADIVYVSVSGFGQTGPGKDRPGYDLIVQAISGLMKLSAMPGGPPSKTGFPVADMLAALFAGQGILAALLRRAKTGEGARIEVSLIESLLAAMAPVTSSVLVAGVDPGSIGGGQANIAPYQVFETADEPIAAGVPNDRIWERFCVAIGKPEWAAEERFKGNAARNQVRAEIVPVIASILKTRPAGEWLSRLEAAGVPAAPVLKISETLSLPMLEERGSIARLRREDGFTMRSVASPIRIHGCEMRKDAPPVLGADTASVLGD